jgi:Zn-dependent membrane protease YugP
MFFYDPLYLLVIGAGMLLAFVPQMWLKNVFAQFSETATSRRQTGAEVARAILNANGLTHVTVEPVEGVLSDHYDPGAKAVRLSHDNYYGASIASVAVAAHEVGHAIQHAKSYTPLVLRSSMAPVVGIGSQMGPILLMVALMMGATSQFMPDWAILLAWLGVVLYGAAVLFHFVTLPVELNASSRATTLLASGHYLTPQEMPGAKKVLTAAAFTYVAAALYALMQLIYFIWRIMMSSRR